MMFRTWELRHESWLQTPSGASTCDADCGGIGWAFPYWHELRHGLVEHLLEEGAGADPSGFGRRSSDPRSMGSGR